MTPHPRLQRCSEMVLRTEFMRSVMDVDNTDQLTIFQTANDAGFDPYNCIDSRKVTDLEKLPNGSVRIVMGDTFCIADTSRIETWQNWLQENQAPGLA
ncbi:MAG: hypothetical protein CMH28_04775 [Micavibrio sp.]|nr:hypothetical protein [Micavibrio sp.]